MTRTNRMLLFASCLAMGVLVAPQSADARRVKSCGAIERDASRLIAGCKARAFNEFDKFKWDFKRKLEKADGNQEEIDELVKRYCTKIEQRGDRYIKRILVKRGGANVLLTVNNCSHGYKSNVDRRAWSYATLIEVAVWDCCEEIEAMGAPDEGEG